MGMGSRSTKRRGTVSAAGVGVMAVVVLVSALGLAGCKSSSPKAPPRTVTVLGRGTAGAEPDTAHVKFSISAKDDAAADALARASTAANAVIKALRGAGVEKTELDTGRVNVAPAREWDKESREMVVTGYTASLPVDLTTKRLEDVGKFITAGTKAGASKVDGPTYRVEQGNKARAAAITAAVKDARSRAEMMAKTAGARLGGVVTITEAGAEEPDWRRGYGLNAGGYGIHGGIAGVPPVLPGKEPLRITVRVVWELK